MVQIAGSIVAALALVSGVTAAPKKMKFYPAPKSDGPMCMAYDENCLGTVNYCQMQNESEKEVQDCIAARDQPKEAPKQAPKEQEQPKKPSQPKFPQHKFPFFDPADSEFCSDQTEDCLGTYGYCELDEHGGYETTDDCIAARDQSKEVPKQAPKEQEQPKKPSQPKFPQHKIPFFDPADSEFCSNQTEDCLGTYGYCELDEHGGYETTDDCIDAREAPTSGLGPGEAAVPAAEAPGPGPA